MEGVAVVEKQYSILHTGTDLFHRRSNTCESAESLELVALRTSDEFRMWLDAAVQIVNLQDG